MSDAFDSNVGRAWLHGRQSKKCDESLKYRHNPLSLFLFPVGALPAVVLSHETANNLNRIFRCGLSRKFSRVL
jgi:hypothetical protein